MPSSLRSLCGTPDCSLAARPTRSVRAGRRATPAMARLVQIRPDLSRSWTRLRPKADRQASARSLGRVRSNMRVTAEVVSTDDAVLVVGATGGVGQIVTAKLLDAGYKVKAVTRSAQKGRELFGGAGDSLEIVEADMRQPGTLETLMKGSSAIACCTGTTAFPSKRWDGDNGPEQTDYVGTKNLVEAAQKAEGLKRFLLVSSVGVDRYTSFPFVILNAFGVLKFKKMGEDILRASGLPFTIIRPGRLTDGPYTSFDLNTLLKATSGNRQDVELSLKDELNGEASRIAVAECVVQALGTGTTEGKVISITSKEGDGPGQEAAAWERLFTALG